MISFFFKPNTAYDMRISDWSSYVCSSDLASSNARSDLQKETSEQQELITMQLRRAAIVSPLRTPVGKFGGGLSSLTAGELGATILKALVERSGIDPERVDDVVFGHGYPSGEAPRSEEHTSELQSLMRISYAVFCLKKKKQNNTM